MDEELARRFVDWLGPSSETNQVWPETGEANHKLWAESIREYLSDPSNSFKVEPLTQCIAWDRWGELYANTPIKKAPQQIFDALIFGDVMPEVEVVNLFNKVLKKICNILHPLDLHKNKTLANYS